MKMTRLIANLLYVVLLMAAAGWSSSASAQTIATTYDGPAQLGPGDQFDVVVEVNDNATSVPVAFALRLDIPAGSLELAGSSSPAGWSLFRGPTEGTSPALFKDFAGYNFDNADLNPTLLTLTFEVVGTQPVTPFDIVLSDDPGTALNLADIDNQPIAHGFDLSGTQGLEVADTGFALLESSIVSGDYNEVGGQFEVLLDISSSTSLYVPRQATIRVTYDPTAVAYTGVTDGDLGAVSVSAETQTGPRTAYRTVTTADVPGNSDPTPAIATLGFEVLPNPTSPYSIVFSDSPATPTPLRANTAGDVAIATQYDNSETVSLSVIDPGAAIVRTELLTPEPLSFAGYFDVRVHVSSNATAVPPGKASLQVSYPGDSAEFVSAWAGDLGTVTVGAPVEAAGSVSRTLVTAGNGANSDETPDVMTLRFRVSRNPFLPIDIRVMGHGAKPLVATDMTTNIQAGFNDNDSRNLDAQDDGWILIASAIENPTGSLDTGGTQFELVGSVASNDSGQFIQSGEMILVFDPDNVSYQGIAGLSYTIVDGGPQPVTAAILAYLQERYEGDFSGYHYVTVSFSGSPPKSPVGTEILRALFEVETNPAIPYQVLLLENPMATNPLDDTGNDPIPVAFNNSNSESLGLGPVTDAIIETAVTSGDPTVEGNQFDVTVRFQANSTGLTPVATALRVTYDSNSVQFISAQSGDLGDLVEGAEEAGAGSLLTKDIVSTGNTVPPNANPTPDVMVLTFEVLNGAYSPYSILVGGDPDSTAPVLAAGLTDSIPTDFDSAATTDIAVTPAGPGEAIVQTAIVGGSTDVPGATFDVAVNVVSNTTGLLPAASAFRVTYNPQSVEFVSATGSDLGALVVGPEQSAGINNFRDFVTQSQVSNTDPTPGVALLRFRVKSDAFVPYSILISSDPDSSAPLLATDLVQSIPVSYDNAPTTDIPGPQVPGGDAVIQSVIVAGDTTVPGATFDVLYRVGSNPTGLLPAGTAIRLNYDTNSVEFVSASAGDLGDPVVGNEEPVVGSEVTRDIVTQGDAANTELLPDIMTVTFRLRNTPFVPFSILASDDPDSTAPLLATNLIDAIPHVYDNSATENLTGPQVGDAVVQSFVSSGDPTTPGEEFEVDVRVVSNPTGLDPIGVAFRVMWEPNAVTFLGGAAPGDLGIPTVGPVEMLNGKAFVDIVTPGNVPVPIATPDVFTLSFRVNDAPYSPYSIQVMDDPDSSIPLLATDLVSPIPHLFNNEDITNIQVDGVPADAIVQTVVSAGNPGVGGGTFDVLTRVAANGTNQIPEAASFRVIYDSESVSFVDAFAEDLGGVVTGNVETLVGNIVYVDVVTQGGASNTSLTPDIFTARFQTLTNAVTPITILVEDDPDSSAPLLATDLSSNIPHVFDTTLTENLAEDVCLYLELSQTSATFDSLGGTGSFDVLGINENCAWTAVSNDSWITITSGASGSGTIGTVEYSVDPFFGLLRTGTISVEGLTFSVVQTGECNFALNPTADSILAAGGQGTFDITPNDAACTYTVTSITPDWLTVLSPTGVTSGPVTVTYEADPNANPQRDGIITVTDGNVSQDFTLTQLGGCVYTLDPSGDAVPATGGTYTFTVDTGAGDLCPWMISSNDSWITVVDPTGGMGTGTSVVTYQVDANPGSQRSGSIAVAGQVFTVIQLRGDCNTMIAPTSASYGPAGGPGTINVTSNFADCGWEAISTVPWVTITMGAQGAGNGMVNYTVAPNGGIDRMGTIIVAGQTFTVSQTGDCQLVLNPASDTFGATGGMGSFTVNATDGSCTFPIHSNDAWVAIESVVSDGLGETIVTYNVDDNTGGLARTGTITVGTETFTVDQAADTCSYAVDPESATFDPAGGSGSFDVTAPDACTWLPVSSAAWVTITNAGDGVGTGTVTYDVDANTGGGERYATIQVGTAMHVVAQVEQPCTYAVVPTTADFGIAGGTTTFDVVAADGCTWTPTPSAGWVSIVDAGDGDGDGTVTIAVDANTGAGRAATVVVGTAVFTVTQQGVGACTYDVDPTSNTIIAAGGTAAFDVIAPDDCTWTPISAVDWVTITNAGDGMGTGTVTYDVAANTGVERTAAIVVGDAVHTIVQAEGCSISVDPIASSEFTANGGDGLFGVIAGRGCAWTATTSDGWILLTQDTGMGNGLVKYTVDENTGTVARTGTITVDGATYTVNQAAPRPVIVLDPNYLTPSVTRPGETEADDDTFEVSNLGTGELDYTVTVTTPSWISVSSNGGTLASGGSTDITVTYSTTTVDPGIYTGFIEISDDNGFAPTQTVVVVLTITDESAQQAPTVQIVSPPADRIVGSDTTTFAFSGTASDADGTVTSVRYRINGGAFEMATDDSSDWSQWSFDALLVPGNNLVEVQSVDNDGLFSPLADRTITRLVGQPVDLLTLTEFTDVWGSANNLGQFEAPFQFDFTGFRHELPRPWKAFAGDFTGDGYTDFATISEFNEVWIAVNDGNRGLDPSGANRNSAGWVIDEELGFSAYVGDFNGDGLADVVQINGTGDLFLGQNTGSTDYESVIPDQQFATTSDLMLSGDTYITVADIDGDGRDDLVQIDNANNGEVMVAYGTPTLSGFTPAESLGETSFSHDPDNSLGVHYGDFDGDGMADIVQIDDTTSATVALLDSDTMEYGDPAVWGVALGFRDDPDRDENEDDTVGWWVFTGDVNGDGLDDLIQINEYGEAWVALSDGTSFDPPVKNASLGFRHTPEGPWQVFVGNAADAEVPIK